MALKFTISLKFIGQFKKPTIVNAYRGLLRVGPGSLARPGKINMPVRALPRPHRANLMRPSTTDTIEGGNFIVCLCSWLVKRGSRLPTKVPAISRLDGYCGSTAAAAAICAAL
jgi:hypothetical protein